MSEPEDTEQVSDSIELKEVAPKPKRVYKKSTKSVDTPPPSLAGNANVIAPLDVPPVSNDSPKGMTQHVSVKEPSPISNDTPVSTPVIKEKKARTQKQIDAFNKMREAYLNKHKTPAIEPSPPVIEPSPPVVEPSPPVIEPEPVKEVYELGTKKVQKPRAKKNKPVATQEETPQVIEPTPPVINNSPTPTIPKVSTAPRFVFV